MAKQAKNVAYVAVGTADKAIEQLRETVKAISKSAKNAGKMLDEMEKRGQRVMGRAKRRTKSARTAALRKTRSRTGSPSRAKTRTRARASTASRRRTRPSASRS